MQQELRQLRNLMLKNTAPIYFADWCHYIALGMEKHIGNLHFLCATDNFNGNHPNLYMPPGFEYDNSLASEQTLNALLRNDKLRTFLKKRGNGKFLTWLFDEETEELLSELGLELCLPTHALRMQWDNKVNTNRLAERAAVPCVPYVISAIHDFEHLCNLTVSIGKDLVVQMPHGMSGTSTFFISKETDFDKHREEICNGEEMKIMKRINCRAAGLEACVTRNGVVTTPLVVELFGQPELTVYEGAWCGNEFLSESFSMEIREMASEYTVKMGEALRDEGYKGYFEADFLIDEDTGTLYLGELNLRFSGFTPLINNSNQAHNDIPLFVLHLAEWMDIDYKLDTAALNRYWLKPENIKQLSFLYVKNPIEKPAEYAKTGVYSIGVDGIPQYNRFALGPEALISDHELFWFSLVSSNSIIGKGDELGALIYRKAVTDDGKYLNKSTKKILNAFLPAE
jgi:hypothetical protein